MLPRKVHYYDTKAQAMIALKKKANPSKYQVIYAPRYNAYIISRKVK